MNTALNHSSCNPSTTAYDEIQQTTSEYKNTIVSHPEFNGDQDISARVELVIDSQSITDIQPVELENEDDDVDITQDKIKNVVNLIKKLYSDVDNDFKENPNLLKNIIEKYPHLKGRQRLTKRTKKIVAKVYVHEFLEKPEYSKYLEGFTRTDKKKIYKYCIKKIKGIYKHAQALKTGYCNLQIINGFSEENTISICITKNTLEANEQWLERLFKELDNRFPHIKLNDKILIISSKKNDLNGNATHCKDVNSAWKHLKRENSFKIIFICSNKIRILDVLEMSEDFQNLHTDLHKKLRIFHDEAHNLKEGIPAYRDLIENILVQPNVLSYTPITASNHPLSDPGNPLWGPDNLQNNGLNYTTFDKTKSTDTKFSSCNKAIRHTFETLAGNPNWVDHNVTQLPKDTFIKVHENDIASYKIALNTYELDQLRGALTREIDLFKKQNIKTTEFDISTIIRSINIYSTRDLIEQIILINVERRRTLEFCDFMKNDKEIEAVNNGLNCLNLNKIIGNYYIPNIFNLHILSTPNRRTLTRFLCEEASKKDFNPIVLGIYGNEGNKYHLMFDKQEAEVSSIMNNGEFNVKLEKLFAYLKDRGININRPFIVIGNYTPTGESLTFVNYKYGVIRGNIRLISTNAEEDYQEASRNNYMVTKFLEIDPTWVMPEKYLIGPKAFIDNALSYEAENDARIDCMLLRTNENINNSISVSSSNAESPLNAGGIVAIPIKVTVDRSDPLVKDMILILEKPRRTSEDKIRFLKLLKEYIDSGEGTIDDPTGKFNFDTFRLEYFRSYKKKNDEGPEKGVWKFASYQNHFSIKTPFINSINGIQVNECELLSCIDTYVLNDKNGKEIEKNLKSVWWIGYKYQ